MPCNMSPSCIFIAQLGISSMCMMCSGLSWESTNTNVHVECGSSSMNVVEVLIFYFLIVPLRMSTYFGEGEY